MVQFVVISSINSAFNSSVVPFQPLWTFASLLRYAMTRLYQLARLHQHPNTVLLSTRANYWCSKGSARACGTLRAGSAGICLRAGNRLSELAPNLPVCRFCTCARKCHAYSAATLARKESLSSPPPLSASENAQSCSCPRLVRESRAVQARHDQSMIETAALIRCYTRMCGPTGAVQPSPPSPAHILFSRRCHRATNSAERALQPRSASHKLGIGSTWCPRAPRIALT